MAVPAFHTLGLGMATLMREPSEKRRRYLLDLAYDMGIRHFDVAPLYGLGRAEQELGNFLSTHSDVSVTTKVGLAPSKLARLLAPIQRPARSVLNRSSTLRRLASRQVADAAPMAVSPERLHSSVTASLQRLQVDRIDYLLMHEKAPADLDGSTAEAVEALMSANRVGRFGVSGAPGTVSEGLSSRPALLSVVQTSDALDPQVSGDGSRITWFHYGVIAKYLNALVARLDHPRMGEVEAVLDQPMRSREQVATALVMLSCGSRGGATTLIGTTQASHLRSLAALSGVELRPNEVVQNALYLVRDLLRQPDLSQNNSRGQRS